LYAAGFDFWSNNIAASSVATLGYIVPVPIRDNPAYVDITQLERMG